MNETDFLTVLDEASCEAHRREVAYRAWVDSARAAVAAELTAELISADMRAARVRFEWTEER
ncbi:MAG: hypothetical protein HOY76_19685 [Streptomyces sp.]|nr:hypothetical protein [Streptomyces sp.]